MAVYRHVNDKAFLLDLVVEALLTEIPLPETNPSWEKLRRGMGESARKVARRQLVSQQTKQGPFQEPQPQGDRRGLRLPHATDRPRHRTRHRNLDLTQRDRTAPGLDAE